MKESRPSIPGPSQPKWWHREWPVEALAVVPPIIAIVVSLVRFWPKSEGDSWSLVYLLGASVVWLIGVGCAKAVLARRKDRERAQASSPADLSGCAYVLYHTVQALLTEPDETLRVTIHRVVKPGSKEGPLKLQQVIDYVGGEGGGAGRTFADKGIIGLTARKNDLHTARRLTDDYQEFLQELIDVWGYDLDEARGLTMDRQSWMAVPICRETRADTIGVVYLDSANRERFADKRIEHVVGVQDRLGGL